MLTFDLDEGDVLSLYVNAIEEDSITSYTHADWSGSGGTGIAWEYDELGGGDTGTYGSFGGQLGIIRYYNWVLSDEEILVNYNAVTAPEPSAIMLLLLGAAALCLPCRRKRRELQR